MKPQVQSRREAHRGGTTVEGGQIGEGPRGSVFEAMQAKLKPSQVLSCNQPVATSQLQPASVRLE